VRVAALYDVHCNVHALDEAYAIRGNCEREVAGDRRELPGELVEVTEWCGEQPGPGALDWLASLPPALSLDGVLYCHATPRSDTEFVTTLTPEDYLQASLDGVDERIVVCGHTHVQFERKRLVNPGSVGWPWDDERGAYWAILDDGVELRRTPYDVEAAAAAIRATDFLFSSFADDLLAPRGAEATMRRFEEARRG